MEKITEGRDNPVVPDKYNYKYSEDQKYTIISLLAQGLTPTQVSHECLTSYGFKTSMTNIRRYRDSEKWGKVYKKLSDEHRSRLDLLDASSKYVRVKRMDKVFDQALEKGELKTAISAQEQIRKEFEGDGDSININFNNPVYQQLNVLSNEELLRKYNEATKKLKELPNGPSGTSEKD